MLVFQILEDCRHNLTKLLLVELCVCTDVGVHRVVLAMKETDLMVMMVLDGQAEVTQGLLEPAAGHA